ncbi:hypothetical protein K9N68_37200 (plasmid) [Kovacikia minuta CCNUW1]|uniref:hypothetical protein n=1 Tax=Kovacikia minuta TaxID=2931930 RepID=UPI001CCFA67D|nr:hypothetical protein [Kovacikia minuta]UBF29850.1 hypothetical protein K9N68_37200 [Kovacikia minuta CCNUW1]
MVEKDGKPVDRLPKSTKRDMEFLFDKGHDPDKEIKMHQSCLPVQGELVVLLDNRQDISGSGIEEKLTNTINSLAKEPHPRKLFLDCWDLKYLAVAEKVLTQMQPRILLLGIHVGITPRTRQAIVGAQRHLKRRFPGRQKVSIEEL